MNEMSAKYLWNVTGRKKQNAREEYVTMPHCPPQILHGLSWERTNPSSLEGGSPAAMADMSTGVWSVNIAYKYYHKRRKSSLKIGCTGIWHRVVCKERTYCLPLQCIKVNPKDGNRNFLRRRSKFLPGCTMLHCHIVVAGITSNLTWRTSYLQYVITLWTCVYVHVINF